METKEACGPGRAGSEDDAPQIRSSLRRARRPRPPGFPSGPPPGSGAGNDVPATHDGTAWETSQPGHGRGSWPGRPPSSWVLATVCWSHRAWDPPIRRVGLQQGLEVPEALGPAWSPRQQGQEVACAAQPPGPRHPPSRSPWMPTSITTANRADNQRRTHDSFQTRVGTCSDDAIANRSQQGISSSLQVRADLVIQATPNPRAASWRLHFRPPGFTPY